MADPVDARERRTRQFDHYLGLMEFRARRLVRADWFVIYSRRVPARLPGAVSAQERFGQFAFHADDFYLDLPDSTLTHAEANRAVAERPGFGFFLGDGSHKPADYEREFDPIQRTYSYAQLRDAAEDTAYLFFDLWAVPLDAWIKVQAQPFSWERHMAIKAHVGFSIPAKRDLARSIADHFCGLGYQLAEQSAGEWLFRRGN